MTVFTKNELFARRGARRGGDRSPGHAQPPRRSARRTTRGSCGPRCGSSSRTSPVARTSAVSTGCSAAARATRCGPRVLEDPSLVGTTDDVSRSRCHPTPTSTRRAASRGRCPSPIASCGTSSSTGWTRSRRAGLVESRFNATFLTGGDSREPELAGVGGATVGSFLTLLVTLLRVLPRRRCRRDPPRGVRAEEPTDRSDRGEHQQSRRGALDRLRPARPRGVPELHEHAALWHRSSAVWCSRSGRCRSSSSSREPRSAAVPTSIREAALGLGASRLQLVTHHLIPLALPGILTGTIIGMAQALGETAPLLMVGMVAFVGRRAGRLPRAGDRAPGAGLPLVGRPRALGFEALTAECDHRTAPVPARPETRLRCSCDSATRRGSEWWSDIDSRTSGAGFGGRTPEPKAPTVGRAEGRRRARGADAIRGPRRLLRREEAGALRRGSRHPREPGHVPDRALGLRGSRRTCAA